MSFTYLASPYSHPDVEVRATRYIAAQDATVWLLGQRRWTYSPIIHCHPLAIGHGLPSDAAFWQDCNFAMLDRAESLLILALPGWTMSLGVDAEATYATKHNIPVNWLLLEPYTISRSSTR